MIKRRAMKVLLRKWLAPSLCLIGLGMVLAIIIPFWLWVLVGGVGLVAYGLWSYLC